MLGAAWELVVSHTGIGTHHASRSCVAVWVHNIIVEGHLHMDHLTHAQSVSTYAHAQRLPLDSDI